MERNKEKKQLTRDAYKPEKGAGCLRLEKHQERNTFRRDFLDSTAQTVMKNSVIEGEFTCP